MQPTVWLIIIVERKIEQWKRFVQIKQKKTNENTKKQELNTIIIIAHDANNLVCENKKSNER